MAHENDTFEQHREVLRSRLCDRSVIPQEEDSNGKHDIFERRFFPSGTVNNVLNDDELLRLFKSLATTELDLQPECLARNASKENPRNFIAVLITAKSSINTFVSFAREALVEDSLPLPSLPVENRELLQRVLGNDGAVNDFLEEQIAFSAPVIKRNEEVRGSYGRLPYKRQKLIGKGSFGDVYEVVVSCLSLHVSSPQSVTRMMPS
jgi:hypothetical protein